jgi:predicted transcriptional regulator of viral defense system
MKNYDVIYEYAADNYGLITSSEAKILGIPNIELVKLAHRGRLHRLGHGVYRVAQYIPTLYDKYAQAVALVGIGAMIYGESVLAMHGLALVNPAVIYIATQSRIRKKLPMYIQIVHMGNPLDETEYEGIPSQSVFQAIQVSRGMVMTDRLIDATNEAEKQGLISKVDASILRKELL